MNKISFVSAGGRVFSVAENRYGNWHGYVSGKRVESFFSDSLSTQEDNAREWLQEQKAAYGEKAESSSRDHLRTMQFRVTITYQGELTAEEARETLESAFGSCGDVVVSAETLRPGRK